MRHLHCGKTPCGLPRPKSNSQSFSLKPAPANQKTGSSLPSYIFTATAGAAGNPVCPAFKACETLIISPHSDHHGYSPEPTSTPRYLLSQVFQSPLTLSSPLPPCLPFPAKTLDTLSQIEPLLFTTLPATKMHNEGPAAAAALSHATHPLMRLRRLCRQISSLTLSVQLLLQGFDRAGPEACNPLPRPIILEQKYGLSPTISLQTWDPARAGTIKDGVGSLYRLAGRRR